MDRSLNLIKAATFIFFLSIALSACGTEPTLHGSGDQAKFVTQADLQHHRWVLESIDGNKIEAAKLGNRVPELEIGEQMMASGHSGCNRFHGKAALRGDRFIIDHVATTRMICPPAQNDIEMLLLQVFGQESKISIDADKNLMLEIDDTLLIFRLQDWVE
jgi:heat shock protein HslJ